MKIEKTELKGVNVKELSGKDLISFLEFTQTLGELTPSKNLEVACLLISMSACDKEGKTLYTPETAKELALTDIQLLVSKISELNNMGEKENLKNAKKDSSFIS